MIGTTRKIVALFSALCLSSPLSQAAEPPNFIAFESASVRPFTRIENQLFVTNTPDNAVEVYNINAAGNLNHLQTIPVGMEPVAMAANDGELWVVNHLSDSVSVIDISSEQAYIKQTLLVGDEPRDIVFSQDKAFISTAHRGQHRDHPSLHDVPGAGPAQTHTPGVPRADVWVFDSNNTGIALGGKPVKIVEMFGDTIRGLAVSADNSTVYAAVFNSGNQTTAVHESVMCYGFEDDEYGAQPCQVMDEITSPNGLAGGQLPGGRPAPGVNVDGDPQPWTSMIVKFDRESGEWRDTKGRNFSNAIRFNLPDKDVFAIDVASLEPVADYKHVGTTLFNMAVNPITGTVYVSNTDANNATRFEGPGTFAGSTVQGNIAKSHITVIDPVSGAVKPRHLNRHINYEQLKAPVTVKQSTIATPTEMSVSKDGKYLFVAALGSNKIAVYPTEGLENDALWDNSGEEFMPQMQQHISVAGGPAGILLDDRTDNGKLFVLTRFDNSIVVVDPATGEEQQRVAMYNPEPELVTAGRFMLYDADRSSSNGESSCASCHIYGDMDHLAWNLGNPDGSNGYNPQPFPTEKFSTLGCDFVGANDPSCELSTIINGNGDLRTFAAMKGPMTTQTMRGMTNAGHMHWRGDRSNGYFDVDYNQTLNEKTSFKNFIVAFEGLLGMDIELPADSKAANKSADVIALEQDIDKFADFMLAVQLPPNPLRGLDNSLSPSAQVGAAFFDGFRRSDGLEQDSNVNGPEQDGVTCEGCHGFDPAEGHYGGDGKVAHGGEIQILKVPHFRNLYQKVGMFGLPDRDGFLPSITSPHQGDQIRGFGFLHDGATDSLFNFLSGGVFDNGEEGCPPGLTSAHGCDFNEGFVGIPDDLTRQGLVDYVLEFDSDLAPIVGQQITINEATDQTQLARLDLLEQRAATAFTSKILGGVTTECDLTVKGLVNGEQRGYLLDNNGNYLSDKQDETALSSAQIRDLAQATNNSLTFTCVPPGSGERIALDRDLDGSYNSDELVAGTDPSDPNSKPVVQPPEPPPQQCTWREWLWGYCSMNG